MGLLLAMPVHNPMEDLICSIIRFLISSLSSTFLKRSIHLFKAISAIAAASLDLLSSNVSKLDAAHTGCLKIESRSIRTFSPLNICSCLSSGKVLASIVRCFKALSAFERVRVQVCVGLLSCSSAFSQLCSESFFVRLFPNNFR